MAALEVLKYFQTPHGVLMLEALQFHTIFILEGYNFLLFLCFLFVQPKAALREAAEPETLLACHVLLHQPCCVGPIRIFASSAAGFHIRCTCNKNIQEQG